MKIFTTVHHFYIESSQNEPMPWTHAPTITSSISIEVIFLGIIFKFHLAVLMMVLQNIKGSELFMT